MYEEEQIGKGIAYILLTFLVVAIMSALGKVAAPYASPLAIVFFQNATSFLIIIPLMCKNGLKTTFSTQRFWVHLFRALTGTACWYCLFVSIKLLGLSVSVLLIYSAPLWIPIMGHFLFGEKSHHTVWLGVIVGFIGIALVLQVHSYKAFENYGVLMGLLGGIFLALAMFAVRWLNKTEQSTTILAYYFLLATLMTAPLCALGGFSIKATTLMTWIVLIGIGVTFAISQLCVVKAFHYASAVKLSPFIYSVIVFTAIIDWLIWYEVPTLIQIIGMILVILGGVFAMRANAANAHKVTH